MAAPHTPIDPSGIDPSGIDSSGMSPAGIDEAKRVMRAERLASRAGRDPTAAGEAVTASVLRDCPPPPGAVVSGFWPLRDEIDIRPLLLALHARGHPIVLPVTPKRGLPLTFRLWQPGDTLIEEKFGTMRPTGEERSPDFLLVPLLAFDRRGGRLGYGAGYYDRTLTLLSPRFALGCAFAAQEAPEVPMGPRDVWLDAVVTERELIRCSRA
jgi:5-formyltetrahydrofolate cyclo-ligase